MLSLVLQQHGSVVFEAQTKQSINDYLNNILFLELFFLLVSTLLVFLDEPLWARTRFLHQAKHTVGYVYLFA